MIEADFDRLSEGARLLIWGVRHWMIALLRGDRVPARVTRLFATAGESGFGSVVAITLLAARDADRALRVLPPCCADLSEDEQRIAAAFDCARRGSIAVADAHLGRLVGGRPSSALLERVRDVARHLTASDAAYAATARRARVA
jgi:GNAT superfamily N-acetyltransferase